MTNLSSPTTAAAMGATESYVISLAHMDVAAAVRRVNDDSGYRVQARMGRLYMTMPTDATSTIAMARFMEREK